MRNMGSALVLSTILGLGCVLCIAQTGSSQSPQPAPNGSAPAAEQTPLSSIPVDQQASKEQIEKLFEVMRLKQQMDSIVKMMPAMIQKQMQEQLQAIRAQVPGGGEISPKEQEELDRFQTRIMEKAMSAYSYQDMIGDMTVVYQRHVSKTDADAFIAFYSSPAGQHLLDEQPAILKEYMPMVTKRMSERSKDLTEEIIKEAAELTKEFGAEPKATSTHK